MSGIYRPIDPWGIYTQTPIGTSMIEEYKLRLLRAQALKAEIELANAITESRLDDHDLDYLVKKVRNALKSPDTLA